MTWRNSPHGLALCAAPHEIRCFDDVTEWCALSTRAWDDHLDSLIMFRNCISLLSVVGPRPLMEREDIVAHVILVQRPLPGIHSLLVNVMESVMDGQVDDGFHEGGL
jgi:hypothetical protein